MSINESCHTNKIENATMYALTTGPSLDSDFRSEVRKYQDYRAVYEDFLRNFEGEDAVEPHGRKLYLNQLVRGNLQ